MDGVEIPHDRLEPETLQSLVEDFITREGTDYGEREISLDTKIKQVMGQLKRREAVIVFDPASESCNIVRK
jgi:uncharacterized protein YheU (UPF0270 family)